MDSTGRSNKSTQILKPSIPAGFITNWKRFLALIEKHSNTQIYHLTYADNQFDSTDSRKTLSPEIVASIKSLLENEYNFDNNQLRKKITGNLRIEGEELVLYPVFWPDGELFSLFVITSDKFSEEHEKNIYELVDIVKSDIRSVLSTKRKEKAISDLRFEKAKARALFSSIPFGVLTVKKSGMIKTANTAALKMFDYTAIEMLKLRLEDLIDNMDGQEKNKKIYNSTGLHTLGPRDNVLGIRKDGEKFPVKMEISYGVNYTQVETIVAIEDLSTCKIFQQELFERSKELEKRIVEQTEYLIGVERQAAFGQLVQGIVHNIKSPLAVVAMNAELLKKHAEEVKADDSKRFDTILKAADRINSIVMSLLTRSREDKEKEIKSVDINGLIEQEVEFLSANPVFKKHVQKNIELYNEPLIADVIPSEISQIIQNLICNSLDAMHDQEDKKIRITTFREGQAILIELEDNGSGIEEEIQDNIFDPFFTTKPKKKDKAGGAPTGTGLGLWMCRSMIESYNGTITLSSEKGVGTTFTIVLPVSEVENQGN